MFQSKTAKHMLEIARRLCGWGRVTGVGPFRSALARKALESFPQWLLGYVTLKLPIFPKYVS